MQPLNLILERFEQVSSIPRGTKNEDAIRAWLVDWAASRGLATKTDETGNLVIYVPASTGYEVHPTIILQGHLDMVCQKTLESDHDFMHDPIRIIRDGDWLKADGTTLGADNGIAIAIGMALAEHESVIHPSLELLFTVEEELGVVGADNLAPSLLTGKMLINLDSEEDGVFTVGCAGGGSLFITLPVQWQSSASEDVAFELKVGGLHGGHSGEDINKNRGNANKLIARVLDFIQRDVPIRLSALKGGTARNAIPRDADAVFVCPREKVVMCRERFAAITKILRSEHSYTEPGLSILLNEKMDKSVNIISSAETVRGIQLLFALPHGVAAMSAEIPGFVETSNNIGIVELKEEGLYVVSNHRSSIFTRLEEIIYRVDALAHLAGANVERTKVSLPWQANMESLLLKKCEQVYQATFGANPKIELSHGGLECGIISDRCGGLDTISLGPTIENPHSPDERLYVPSLENVWKLLTELLKSF